MPTIELFNPLLSGNPKIGTLANSEDPGSALFDTCYVYRRGSYMSAHVLLNLLKTLGKRDEMQGLPCILSLFLNEFNKFNNTIAGMLDSIYHMTLRLL